MKHLYCKHCGRNFPKGYGLKRRIRDAVVLDHLNLAEAGKRFHCTREYVRQVLIYFGFNIRKLRGKNPIAYRRQKIRQHSCTVCGKVFVSLAFRQKTCSRRCHSKLMRRIVWGRICTWGPKLSKAWTPSRRQHHSKLMRAYWRKLQKEAA